MSEPISFHPPDPAELTELLKGYEVTDLIAAGGMGAVYRAKQLSLDRFVAIKLLPAEMGDDPSFRNLFHAEARAMARLNHVNLIGIYDFGETKGMPYIVMEFVAGKSLHDSSHGKAIDQTTAVEIVIGMCRGLAHAHRAGIIHRDIKPANILLDPKAQPKIGDFGLAAAIDSDEHDGPLYGTPGYAAPEVYGNPKAIGNPFDIYAVGVILYELLTGKMPEEPTSPPSTVSRCDRRLDPIFKKATRRNPALRYQDADEMASDLETLLPTLQTTGPKKIRTAQDAGQPKLVTLKRQPSPSPVDEGSKEGKPKLVPLPKDKEPSPPEKQKDGKPKLVPLAKGQKPPAATLKPLPQSVAAPPRDPAPTPPAPTPAPVATKVGSNWPIIRNLIIIAILIPIVLFTWGKYKEKAARQKAEQEEAAAKRQQDIKEKEALAEKTRRESERRAREIAEEAEAKALAEKKRQELLAMEAAKTPEERLAEFRRDLVSGRRDKFPDDTIDRSTHFLYFVNTPMTWGEACQFAESHGGHLAAPSTRADLDVLTKRMGNEYSRIWIGGGAQGKQGWAWITGEEWTFKDPGTTLGACASLSSSGVIRARPYAEKNPFVIQWSKDGENRGSLAAQLERLVPTLDTPSPAWPPATVVHDSRHFLLVQKPLSWSEADLVAASSEGHLAVVSERSEAIFLEKYLERALAPDTAIWLGGKKEDDLWTWTTGEAWEKARWADNSPDGGPADNVLRFLQAADGAGWDDASPDAENASGFLIEWSSDADRATTTGQANPLAELSRMRKIARRLVASEVDEYNKFLRANQDAFIVDARVWFDILKETDKEAVGEAYEMVIDSLPPDGNLPGNVNVNSIPEDLRDDFKKAVERQVERKKKLDEKLESLRLNYLGKLATLSEQLDENGLKSQMKTISSEMEEIGQTAESFRAAMGQ